MYDLGHVGRAQAVAELAEQRAELARRESAPMADHRGEVPAVEQLHRQIRQLSGGIDPGADDFDHMLAGDRCADRRLPDKPRPTALVVEQPAVHHLERPDLARALLLGAIDRAHAALGQRSQDAVVAGEQGPGGEPRGRRHAESQCIREAFALEPSRGLARLQHPHAAA